MSHSYIEYHHTTQALVQLLFLLGIESAKERIDDVDFEIKNALLPDPTCDCGCC